MTVLMSTAVLAPTNDATAVEKAVVYDLADGSEPETFLQINFHRPIGGVRIRYAWTSGGQPLGDHIDQIALAKGLDAADWLHIGNRHQQTSTRGRIEIWTYTLRPVLADVVGGDRSPEERREGLRRVVRAASRATGQPFRTLTPRWLGFGPVLLAGRTI